MNLSCKNVKLFPGVKVLIFICMLHRLQVSLFATEIKVGAVYIGTGTPTQLGHA